MRDRKVPFDSGFEDAMLGEIKTATSRTYQIGDVGDTFKAFGAIFEITQVCTAKLGDVANYNYRVEGCSSTEEFIRIWKRIYRWFNPNYIVWFHRFRLVHMYAR